MHSKHKHNIAIFFLMAFMVMLADSTLHALLHAGMHHTHDVNTHHGCSHGHADDVIELSIAGLENGLSMFEESDHGSCMRCAEYLVQEHSQLASIYHTLVVAQWDCQVATVSAILTSHSVEQLFLRGPPEA